MRLVWVDWMLIGLYFAVAIWIGIKFTRRAGRSLADYFISGRHLPWWLAGTSMVATTFAADTPLAVTGLVGKYGIAGNWLWWNMVMSGMLTVFFYARLWRRSGVLTDVEFTEIRYSGKPAAILRGFRALYLALPVNLIIMGWVTLAMAKILGIALGVGKWEAIAICLGITLLYSTLAGLWGVVVTDFVQFFIAMAGSILLAIFALKGVGGITGLKVQLASLYPDSQDILAFTPRVGSVWMPVLTFLVYLGVNWWAAWYPGAEPGGGGYIAQRIFSARDEKHSLLATLWFNVAHYALRPWPWILVALVSMVVYPELADKEAGYVKIMVDFLPPGVVGLLLASFAAAFMSTISTQINWGGSYIVNDFYRRFLRPNASERHYVWVSRLTTIALMLLAAVVTHYLGSIEKAWKFLLALGAGTGAVYILRWFWWRINAWSEISAMIASFVASTLLQTVFGLDSGKPLDFAYLMLITVGFSSVVWVSTTLLTPPESEKVLVNFYRAVRPGGRLWGAIAHKAGTLSTQSPLSRDFLDWIAGCVVVYCSLFGIGKMLLGDAWEGGLFFLVGGIAFGWIFSDLSRRRWEVLSK